MSTERDDTHVSAENEYFSALDLDDLSDEELENGEPEDLAQIRSDDALLDALAAQFRAAEEPGVDGPGPDQRGVDQRGVDFDDEQLNALLVAWRQDVDSVPVPEIVDTHTAVATVTAAKSARRRRPRLLVPIAVAAAVVAIGFAGVGMLARDAQPGDALWGLSKVLYADHARSVEAAQSVRTDLNDAQTALQQGKIDEAKDALRAAGSALSAVSSEDGKDDLKAKHESLLEQLTSTAPFTPTVPPATQRSETTPAPPSSVLTTPTPPTSVKPSDTPSQPPTSSATPPSSQPTGPNSATEEPPPPVGGGPGRSDSPSPNGVSSNNVGQGDQTPSGT
ncbi:anti-sigma-D factor RsdA [Actinocrispum sp. NPDC049592]|uniref:anti-sigma-D factor RsdA n=1 Tax=Actinocrispum sp. NPDC049592 TaxID=3154835 RepID=UPI00343FAB10